MPLNREVGLGPGDIVLDGYPAILPKGTGPLNFRRMSIVDKRSPISAIDDLLLRYLTLNVFFHNGTN